MRPHFMTILFAVAMLSSSAMAADTSIVIPGDSTQGTTSDVQPDAGDTQPVSDLSQPYNWLAITLECTSADAELVSSSTLITELRRALKASELLGELPISTRSKHKDLDDAVEDGKVILKVDCSPTYTSGPGDSHEIPPVLGISVPVEEKIFTAFVSVEVEVLAPDGNIVSEYEAAGTASTTAWYAMGIAIKKASRADLMAEACQAAIADLVAQLEEN